MNDKRQISHNGLARLIKFDSLVYVVGLVFLGGITYNSIGENTKKIEASGDEIKMLEVHQTEVREDVAELKTAVEFQIDNQRRMQEDINRILNILEERR